MIDDENTLIERIAIALNDLTPEKWEAIDRDKHGPGLKRLALREAARALPIIRAEVLKGQVQAWDEGFREGEDNAHRMGRFPNPYREELDNA